MCSSVNFRYDIVFKSTRLHTHTIHLGENKTNESQRFDDWTLSWLFWSNYWLTWHRFFLIRCGFLLWYCCSVRLNRLIVVQLCYFLRRLLLVYGVEHITQSHQTTISVYRLFSRSVFISLDIWWLFNTHVIRASTKVTHVDDFRCGVLVNCVCMCMLVKKGHTHTTATHRVTTHITLIGRLISIQFQFVFHFDG